VSPSTPVLGLPYPVDGNTADVPRDMKALAEKLDGLGGVPVGVLMIWTGAVAPSGWLLCQGQTVLASSYPGLASVLGSAGGNVTLPNLSDRVPLGASGSRPLKSTGGAATVALTAAQTAIRNHVHGSSGSGLSFLGQASLGIIGWLAGPGSQGVSGFSTTGNPTGGEVNGAAHENLPPYLAVNYIIRAG
jgi:microcystin-dependent protein